jgi:hypothetical protein
VLFKYVYGAVLFCLIFAFFHEYLVRKKEKKKPEEKEKEKEKKKKPKKVKKKKKQFVKVCQLCKLTRFV